MSDEAPAHGALHAHVQRLRALADGLRDDALEPRRAAALVEEAAAAATSASAELERLAREAATGGDAIPTRGYVPPGQDRLL